MSTSSVDNNRNRNNQGQPPSPVGSQIPYQESSGSDGPMRDPRGNITVYEKMCVLMDSDDRSTGGLH